MTKSRVEAFSDGVIAIIITIMVIEFRPPHETTWESLKPLMPVLMSYILSFVFLGVYWNNHHHLFQAVKNVSGKVLWANLHLLFWLSLIPFVTAWMGENVFAASPVAAYGIVLLGAASAYWILVRSLLRHHGPDSHLAKAIGGDSKGNISLVLYLIAVATSFWLPAVSGVIYALVAAMWLIPDSRIERLLPAQENEHTPH